MKNVIPTILTLIVSLIVAYFAYNLEKEAVDLRYTISEKIPTKYIEYATAETVQQLVVKNIGNISAEKISIKINGDITGFDILKNSISDEVIEHNSNGYFEATYPSLPPGTQFSYVFTTSGLGLSESTIGITHNRGKGTAALSSTVESRSKVLSWVSWVLIIIYFFLIGIEIRSRAVKRLEDNSRHSDFNIFLRKTKPFYISQDKWNSIRKIYIEKKSEIDKLFIRDIEDSDCFKILNNNKPSYLSNDEWELFKGSSTKSIMDHLVYSIQSRSFRSELSKYFTIVKPQHFPQSKWDELVSLMSDCFINSRKFSLFTYETIEGIVKELKTAAPKGVPPEKWDEYQNDLRSKCYSLILGRIYRVIYPLDEFKNIDISIFCQKQQEELKDLAYRIQLLVYGGINSTYEAEVFLESDKPNWLRTLDLKDLTKKAETYIDVRDSKIKYQYLLSAIEQITNNIPLKDKPMDAIKDSEWQDIKELESRTSAIVSKIKVEQSELADEKQESRKLITKVLKQLEVINDVLREPESLSKIESYDNPFSEGNFKNLQLISKRITDLDSNKLVKV